MEREELDELERERKSQLVQQELRSMPPQDRGYGADFFNYFTNLIQVENVPEEIANELWALSNRVHQITQFTEKDIRIMMRNFDNVITRWCMSIPEWEYTYELDTAFKQLEMLFYSMIKRSENGFERRMQATQIRQVETNPGEVGEQHPRTGIMGKIGRLFGR